MKRFAFKLESVLGYKKAVEEITIKELSLIMAQLEREKERLAGMAQYYEDLIDGFDADVEKSVTEIALYTNHLKGIKDDIKEAEGVVEMFAKKWAEKREEVIKATTERKSIEILKKRGLDLHNIEMSRLEQSIMDEVAGNMNNRGKAGANPKDKSGSGVNNG